MPLAGLRSLRKGNCPGTWASRGVTAPQDQVAQSLGQWGGINYSWRFSGHGVLIGSEEEAGGTWLLVLEERPFFPLSPFNLCFPVGDPGISSLLKSLGKVVHQVQT